MSVAEYAGRQYDVLVFRGAKPRGEVLLSQTLFDADKYGEICVGIQKLAQRWLLEFLTIRGTVRFAPTRGTRFMQHFYAGRFRTEADIATSFAFAGVEAGDNLRDEEVATMPDDERFDYAALQKIAILPGLIQLTVRIVSLAGTSRNVILPLSHTV
jgi:hypothetical protein